MRNVISKQLCRVKTREESVYTRYRPQIDSLAQKQRERTSIQVEFSWYRTISSNAHRIVVSILRPNSEV